MGLYRQQYVAYKVMKRLAWLLGLLLSVAAAAQSNPTSACGCDDISTIQNRIKKLNLAKDWFQKVLAQAPPDAPAEQETWIDAQNGLRNYFQAMAMQDLTVSSDNSLFNNNPDPFCGAPVNAPSACLNEDYAVHQKVHEASCRTGSWSFQHLWVASIMLNEEISALQAEIDFLQAHSTCTAPKEIAPVTPQGQQMVAQCPAFLLNVQTLTVSALNTAGLAEQSQRSLNGGNGVSIPLIVNDDGSFQGSGSGSSGGSVASVTGGQNRMTPMQASTINMQASGVIQPGSCSVQPCQPDVMHLMLSGNSSRGGAANLPFDLPAYVGGMAQRTLLAMGPFNSAMVVTLLQGNNGSAALPTGSSVLYSLSQCKTASVQPENRNGIGLAIPGMEGITTTPTSKPAPSGQNTNIGLVIPGLDAGANTPPPAQGVLQPPSTPAGNLKVAVNESLKLSDVSAAPSPHTVVAINESLQMADASEAPAPHLSVHVNESFKASDVLTAPITPAVILVNEGIHVSDKPASSPGVAINVSEGVHVSDMPSTLPSVDVTINEGVVVTESDAESTTSQPSMVVPK